MTNTTERLASLVSEIGYANLSQDVVMEAKRLILDCIGCALGGYHSEIGQIATRYVMNLGGSPQSTVAGVGQKTSCTNAAYANGKMGNALDYDDTFLTGTHFGLPAVAAALALCEMAGRPGKDFITSVVAGFETGARVAMGMPNIVAAIRTGSAGKPDSFARGFGVSSSMVFAACGAAAKALGLDAKMALETLNIGGGNCPIPSHRKWTGSMVGPLIKYADEGWCSMTGVAAALLAKEGYTGYDNILDGEFGFYAMYGADSFDHDTALRGLGEQWQLLRTTYKYWPTCRWPNYTLTAFDKLMGEARLQPEDIDQIVVRTLPQALSPRFTTQEPANMVVAQFSFAHALAMFALGIPRGPQWYSSETLTDPKVIAFRHKVKVELEPRTLEMDKWTEDGQIRRVPNSIEVVARGRVLSATTDYAKGDSWMPDYALTNQDLEAKLIEQVSSGGKAETMPPNQIQRLIELIWNLEEVGNVAELTACLGYTTST